MIICDYLWRKAGMCLGPCTVLPSNGLHLVDKEEKFQPLSKQCVRKPPSSVSASPVAERKKQNVSLGSMPSPVMVNSNIDDPVQEFTYLVSLQSSHSNFGPEYIRRIGLPGCLAIRADAIRLEERNYPPAIQRKGQQKSTQELQRHHPTVYTW